MKLFEEVITFLEDNLEYILSTRKVYSLKDDNSIVTPADVFIEEGVKDISKKYYKSICFIGEESYTEGSVSNEEYTLVIDPIDGTENFYSGLPEWGVSLSLWRNQQHIESILYFPELKIKIDSSNKISKKFKSRIIGLSSEVNKDFINYLKSDYQYRVLGSAVYNLYNTILGKYKCFIHIKGAFSWDILAGIQIAHKNGLKIKIDGEIYKGNYLEPGVRYALEVTNE